MLKLVEFVDGLYGIRKQGLFSWLTKEYKYLDFKAREGIFWPKSSPYYLNDCRTDKIMATEKLLQMQDYGKITDVDKNQWGV